MPLVNVKVIEQIFTSQQKRELVGKLTDAIASVAGEGLRPVTSVIIEEVQGGDWGIGGKPVTVEAVKQMMGQKPT